jgi:LysR family cys regulon transcriptional activator
MKLHQLKLFKAIVDHGMNMSQAAEVLYTSQPGISKQIKMFEEELGVELFVRAGKHLTDLTPVGQALLTQITNILQETENVLRIADEYKQEGQGTLRIATTHTQARYVLPPFISEFRAEYPDVRLELHQGTPEQIAELASRGEVDFAIATEAMEHFDNLIMMPVYRWNRAVIVPKGHSLTNTPVTIENIAQHPIVTYVFGFTGRSQLDDAFSAANLQPNVVLTASDTDVIKTYVRQGFGIGIVARMAYDAQHDQDLVALNAEHLFNWGVTRIGFRKGLFLRKYMYTFIEKFAPHLTKPIVEKYLEQSIKGGIEDIIKPQSLPHY